MFASRILFCSRASIVQSFRSKCGSKHGKPEYKWQRSPAAAPQVGHGTDDSSLGVSSTILIQIFCDNIRPETVQLGTLSVPACSANSDGVCVQSRINAQTGDVKSWYADIPQCDQPGVTLPAQQSLQMVNGHLNSRETRRSPCNSERFTASP